MCLIATNGPAIWGGCVTRRQHRHESVPVGQKTVPVQGGYGSLFASHGTNFITCWRDRGTSIIGAGKLSPYRIFIRSTRAVSRYNFSRSQKSVTVQDLDGVQVRVSGYKMLNEFIWPADSQDEKWLKEKRTFGPILNIRFLLGWRARHQAKSVTNNLPILSVLAFRWD
jgi:hypothetical protein